MQEQIKEINSKIQKHSIKLRQYEEALEALQLICKHNWKYEGHSHNSDYYVCLSCGKTKED